MKFFVPILAFLACLVASAASDDLLSGATSNASAWKCGSASCRATPEGMLFVSGGEPSETVSFQTRCPPEAAGKRVAFEIELENCSDFAWGGKIFVRQTTASLILPETVVDSRWISHSRPPGKRFRIRTKGHVHPKAKHLRVEMQLPCKPPAFNAAGMPVQGSKDLRTCLLVTRLSLHVEESPAAAEYADGFFADDVAGGSGASLLFDGTCAFWYQTRSLAAWSLGQQIFGEENVFFPFADGTVEAWFKPAWKEDDDRFFTLFEAAHDGLGGTLANQSMKSLGRMFSLEYAPKSGMWRLSFRDVRRREFSACSAAGAERMRTGTWSHVAAQWSPGGTGEVFVSGRRVVSLRLDGMKTADALNPKARPNETSPATCRLGSSFMALAPGSDPGAFPLYIGTADGWRVSTGKRYADGFRPEKNLTVDASTRAFFGFDHSFDGSSGGGLGFIPGSLFAQRSRTAGHSATLRRDVDPDVVLDRLNYPDLPSPDDFLAARKERCASFSLRPGESAVVAAASGAIADWVEIANDENVPLVHPIVLNKGDVDPRSFADIRETLGLDGLDDRAKSDALFRYALRSVDYFGTNQLTFDPGGDYARGLSHDPLLHLNAYCGFECRMLNILLSSMFTLSGDLPSSLLAGYNHTFEHVFYDGRNRVYDLSMQTFVPSMSNDEVASLEEIENEPGAIARCGSDYARFVRSGTRGTYADGPFFGRRIAMTLDPGEKFRAWFANDGTFNDLQSKQRPGVQSADDPDDRRRETHGVPASGGRRTAIRRFDRVLPEYANGFISFDGRPSASNTAFCNVEASGFCYDVESPYPIVAAFYRAASADGREIPLELSTDGGVSFRPLASGRVEYPVRARHAYLVRVKSPIGTVARFEAETEVMLNARVFPGRIRAGVNTLTLKAERGGRAKISVGWRESGGRIAVEGGLFHGAIPGSERQTVLLAPGECASFRVCGASQAAQATGFGGIDAKIADGCLVISDHSPQTAPRVAGVEIRDGACVRQLGVIVSANARLVTAEGATVHGGAKTVLADGTSPQTRVLFPSLTPGSRATLRFPELPAGRYQVYLLDRFASHPKSLNAKPLGILLDGGTRVIDVGSPGARAYNYAKAHFGRKGARANWKWDVKWEFKSTGSHPESFDMPAFGTIDCVVTGSCEAVELAGALIVPEPTTRFSCGLLRTLLGLNCQPERVRGAHLDGFDEFACQAAAAEQSFTERLQSEIDAAHAAGGGTVSVPEGCWETGGIRLKSGVRLHLPKGATLLGSTNRADWAGGCASLLRADGASDVSVTGEGTIDGRGAAICRLGCRPPHLIDFISCTNVLVEGVRLRNAGSWMLQLRDCLGATVRKGNLFNHAALCNDGIDIASSRVLIEDCDIDTGDDAIALKTFSPKHVVEDVTVRNCRLASGCNAFKIGTESHGTVRRVRVSDCRIAPPSDLLIWERRVAVPGLTGRLVGSAAIAIESVDGGLVDDVEVKNISGGGVQTPIFIRLGHRRESRRGERARLENIRIEDVELTASSRIACSITGVKGLRPRGILIRNARLVQRGGGTLQDVRVPVPERDSAYPENRMFDLLPLPAYGFYVRHADDIRFQNVELSYEGGREERPAVFTEDATLSVEGQCRFVPPSGEFSGRAVYRPSADELSKLRAAYWKGLSVAGGIFSAHKDGASAPLLVYCGCRGQEQMMAAINYGRIHGLNVLLPGVDTTVGVLEAINAIVGRYAPGRIGLKADDSSLALSLLAAEPGRWAAVTVCNPGDEIPDGLMRARGRAEVHIIVGAKNAGLGAACKAFNLLADENDRISDDDCSRLAKERKAWRKEDNPGRRRGYDENSGRHLVFSRRSCRTRISVCDTDRVVSHSPELDFLRDTLRRKTAGKQYPILGYMLDISRNKVPTMKSLRRIVDVISSLGYTQFQLYMEHTFAYKNHETVWKGASPMTSEEVRELDAYCASRGVDLVPNQNSFGHLENWFRHKEYLHLAEMPEGGVVGWRTFKTPRALCPTDPRSMKFVEELYSELLPNFRSKLVNVGCDEVWELNKRNGKGRSRAAIKSFGAEHVYLAHLRKVCSLAAKMGKTAMFWDDMIVRAHPELICELPEDAIALDWGYEVGHSHSFEADCAALSKGGRRFYVCPGTSGWDSISGRHFNMKTNVQEAVRAGLRHGAEGCLMTDWGDGGMCQPWLTALPALVYMAHAVRGEWLSDAEIAHEVDRICGAKCGDALIQYQNLYLLDGNPHIIGKVLTFKMLSEGRNWKRPAKGMTDGDLASLFRARKAAKDSLDLSGAPEWVVDGFATLDILYDALEMRWKGEHNKVASECAPRFAELWLRHNKPGGLNKTIAGIFR